MPKLKTLLILLPLLTVTNVLADAAAAFTEGSQFGKENVGNTKGQITQGNATTSVPNYTPTDSASNYYLDGKGSLTAPAAGDVTDCTSTPGSADANAHTHGKCEGVRMLMSDPGKKNAMFPLNKNTDPLVIERNNVRANPESYLGTLNPTGNYGACVDKTINEPDTYTEEVCNQALVLESHTCTRGFSPQVGVTINTTDFSVNPGSNVGQYSASTFRYNLKISGTPTQAILKYYQIDNYGQVWVNGILVYQNILPGYADMRDGSVVYLCSGSCNYYFRAKGWSGSFYDDGCNSGCRGLSLGLDITRFFKEGDNEITLVCANARKIGPCRVDIVGTGRKLEFLGSLVNNNCAAYEERAK